VTLQLEVSRFVQETTQTAQQETQIIFWNDTKAYAWNRSSEGLSYSVSSDRAKLPVLLGLRTVIYKVPDLTTGKAWYSRVFGIAPYFDEPFYVGFNVGGYELGLDPDVSRQGAAPGGSVAYWGVADLAATMRTLEGEGVTITSPLADVGGDIKVATIADPFGNLIGLIENPGFALP
jgi:predicted enzyme related to lactoylglutathione lyase